MTKKKLEKKAVEPKEKLSKEQIEKAKNHAKLLFVREGVTTHKEIAAITGISPKTIGRWVADEGWEKLQRNFLLTREEEMANLLDELIELNAFIRRKAEGMRFADAKEGDVRRKLIKDIKELETKASLPEIIHTCKLLLDFARKADLTQAQQLSRIIDAFVKSQLR